MFFIFKWKLKSWCHHHLVVNSQTKVRCSETPPGVGRQETKVHTYTNQCKQVSRLAYEQSCLSFTISFIMLNCYLLTFLIPWLWPFVVHNCLKKVINSLKNTPNYIMNDINSKRPFPLREQSWYRTALRKKSSLFTRNVCVNANKFIKV